MKDELERVRELARAKLQGGQEPPWAWYQYMKLVEACDAILAGMDAVTTADSQESPSQSERHLRLVGQADRPDSTPRRPAGLPVQLPM